MSLVGYARFRTERGDARTRHDSRSQQGRAIVGRHPGWNLDAEAEQELPEIGGPRDGNSDISDGILEDEVPADNPCNQFTQCCIAVCVC